MDLREVNLSKAIEASSLDKKLDGLKWITPKYPENPESEISKLAEQAEKKKTHQAEDAAKKAKAKAKEEGTKNKIPNLN